MMRHSCLPQTLLAVSLLLAASAAFGQSAGAVVSGDSTVAEPSSELRLPDMNEEARAVAPQDVDAPPLPAASALPAPAQEPPMPAAAELAIPESAYRTEATLGSGTTAGQGATFTEASVGAGLWDAVSASLSIYRPSADPSFGMTFSHDSLDGFAFHDPGEGYYERTTSLSGRVKGSAGGLSAWGFSAGFDDEAYGLQGLSTDFYGVGHRYFDARGDYRRSLGSLLGGALSASAVADGSYASRSLELSQDDLDGVLNVNEVILAPSASLGWKNGRLDLTLDGAYDFRGLTGLSSSDEPDDRYSHRAGADLKASLEWSDALAVGASVGVVSSSSFPVLVPFSLSADAALGTFAVLSVKGGLRTDTRSFADAWRDNPYLDVGELPPDDARWFGAGKIDFFLLPGLVARAGADWASSLADGGRIVPVEPADGSARGLYTYEIDDYRTLLSSFSLRWAKGGASVSAGWEADLLDAPVVGKSRRLTGQLEYRDPAEGYGAAVSSSVGWDGDGFDLPVLDLSGFIRLTKEIRFIVQADDVAAAFKGEDGRTRWSPYLTSGFQASARFQLSF